MKTYIKPSTEIVETNLTTDLMQLGFSNDTGDSDWKSPRRKNQDLPIYVEDDEDYEDFGW